MHVVLAGLDGLGLRTLEQLLADGHRVTCVAPPGASAHADDARALGAPVVQGDHRRVGVLREAGLASADALIVTVEDDVANLHCALAAQDERPGLRVVVRMFSHDARRPGRGPRARRALPQRLRARRPALVAAALVDEGGQRLEVLGRRLVVGRAARAAQPLARRCRAASRSSTTTPPIGTPGPGAPAPGGCSPPSATSWATAACTGSGSRIAVLVAISTAVFARLPRAARRGRALHQRHGRRPRSASATSRCSASRSASRPSPCW